VDTCSGCVYVLSFLFYITLYYLLCTCIINYYVNTCADFVNQVEVNRFSKVKQDWTKNFDGTVDTTGQVTRGAVLDFFSDASSDHERQITVTYNEKNKFFSWAVRK
jgi:hypothetical protein